MGEYRLDPQNCGEDIMKVMRVIRKKKASYPSEIAQTTRFNIDYVLVIISYLIDAGYIERIPMLDPYTIDERLTFRRPEMFAKGVTGFRSWCRFHWVGFRDWGLHYQLRASEKAKNVTTLVKDELK